MRQIVPIGRPIKLDSPTKEFRKIADRANLPRVLTLHSLRHSFGSWSLANGGDIMAVQCLLGHSKPSTTLNLYGHALPGQREKAVAAANRTLKLARAATVVDEGNEAKEGRLA